MSDTEQDVASRVDATGGQQRSEQGRQLAEPLVEQAEGRGLDLVGPTGFSPA